MDARRGRPRLRRLASGVGRRAARRRYAGQGTRPGRRRACLPLRPGAGRRDERLLGGRSARCARGRAPGRAVRHAGVRHRASRGRRELTRRDARARRRLSGARRREAPRPRDGRADRRPAGLRRLAAGSSERAGRARPGVGPRHARRPARGARRSRPAASQRGGCAPPGRGRGPWPRPIRARLRSSASWHSSPARCSDAGHRCHAGRADEIAAEIVAVMDRQGWLDHLRGAGGAGGLRPVGPADHGPSPAG